MNQEEARTQSLQEELEPVKRLTKDLIEATKTLTPKEIRYLVNSYYDLQHFRTIAANQARALTSTEQPCSAITWLYDQHRTLEAQVKRALAGWVEGRDIGKWLTSITGVGPCISAGLLAHIDIERAPTAGHIWRLSGLDPSLRWWSAEDARKLVAEVVGAEDKSKITLEAHLQPIADRMNLRATTLQERMNFLDEGAKPSAELLKKAISLCPWNQKLKVLTYKAGDCFVKFQNNEKDHYGRVYVRRKAEESVRNVKGEYAEQAERILREKKIGKGTEAYKAYSVGQLPPGHLHSRAQRYAVKLFLSHVQCAMHWDRYGQLPAAPFAIGQLGHAHYFAPPNANLLEGFEQALKDAGAQGIR